MARENAAVGCRFWIGLISFMTLLIIGVSVGLSLYFTGNPNPIDYIIPQDPSNLNITLLWPATAGLSLTIENACESKWAGYFATAMSDWNKSEALSLSSVDVDYDKDCEPSIGRLKMCNGDYGNTDWKGLNSNVFDGEVIVYSVSRLNDRHLKTSDDMQYTMCHEMGHGFGLPHTDENLYNLDRGDCLDYTSFPQHNLVPGDYNLDLLVELYGTPDQPIDRYLRWDSSTWADSSGSIAANHLGATVKMQIALAEDNCRATFCSQELGDGYHIEISKVPADQRLISE